MPLQLDLTYKDSFAGKRPRFTVTEQSLVSLMVTPVIHYGSAEAPVTKGTDAPLHVAVEFISGSHQTRKETHTLRSESLSFCSENNNAINLF